MNKLMYPEREHFKHRPQWRQALRIYRKNVRFSSRKQPESMGANRETVRSKFKHTSTQQRSKVTSPKIVARKKKFRKQLRKLEFPILDHHYVKKPPKAII